MIIHESRDIANFDSSCGKAKRRGKLENKGGEKAQPKQSVRMTG